MVKKFMSAQAGFKAGKSCGGQELPSFNHGKLLCNDK